MPAIVNVTPLKPHNVNNPPPVGQPLQMLGQLTFSATLATDARLAGAAGTIAI